MKFNFKSVLAVTFAVATLVLTGCGNEAKKISVPSASECEQAQVIGIKQTNEIDDETNDKEYVLTDYDLGNGHIVYTYTEKKEQLKSITVTGIKMTYDEFKSALPTNVELKDANVNGIACKYLERTVHYVPDDYEVSDRVKENVKKGTTEIKYGSRSDLDQLLPIQRMYWFDSANNIGYSLEIMGEYYQMADLNKFVLNYTTNAK